MPEMKTRKTKWHLPLAAGFFAVVASAAQTEPVSVLDLVHQSQEAAQLGHVDSALDLARQATEQDAGYVGAWKQLGSVLLLQQDYAEAVEPLRTAASLDPDNGSVLRELSTAQWKTGQTNAALESLRAACELDPANAKGWRDLAGWLQAAGQPEAALEPFEKAVALDPADAPAWRDMGWLLWALDRREESVAAFDSAIRGGVENHRELATQIAALLIENNQTDQALASLSQWEPGASLLDLAIPLVEKGRLQAAKALLIRSWEQKENPSKTGLYLAYAHALSGSFRDVPVYLAPFLETLDSKTQADQARLAQETLQAGADALADPAIVFEFDDRLANALREEPRHLDLLEKTAGSMRYRRNEAAAAQLYRRVLDRNPDRPAWLDAFELELKLEGSGAADTWLAGLRKRATSVVVRAAAEGLAAQRNGRAEDAIAGYETSLAADPEQPRLRQFLFDLYLSTGRLADARAIAEWMERKILEGQDSLRAQAAEMWTTLGEPDRAMDWWQILHLAAPGVSDYAVELAAAHYGACRPDEAIEILEEQIAATPSPRAYELLAEIQLALGRYDQATETARDGLAVTPSPGLHRAFAENAEAAGLVSTASVAAARALLAADPGHVQGSLLASRQWQALGQTNEAVEFQERLLQRNPDFFAVLVALKNAASANGEFAKALRYSEAIIAERPWDLESQFRHAIALSEAERVRGSLQLLRRLARQNRPQDVVPVLLYRLVTECPYPGRNNIDQLTAHLRRLHAEGFQLVTPAQIHYPLPRRQAIVVLEDADRTVLEAADKVLEEIGGRAVYAGHLGILTRAVPGKPSPEELRRFAASGRWLIASGGPENDRRQRIAKDGLLGNPFTHPIYQGTRAESDAAFRKRLETEFAAAAAPVAAAPAKILLYPQGDYGQASLDTRREYRDLYRNVVSNHFDMAIFYDDNGFLAPGFDPLKIPARVVPASWSAERLAEHLVQENPAVRGPFELGKLLYWNRQHEEANYWFNRALAAGANPRDVSFNRGANAVQQDDLPVALAQLRRAQELDPASPKVARALENAMDRKRLAIELGGRSWEDNEGRSYEQVSAEARGHVLDGLRLGGFANANRWKTEGLGDERGTRIGADARGYLLPQIWLEGQLWQLQFEDELDDLLGGEVRLHLPNRLLSGFADLEYSRQEIETVEALRAGIHADTYGLATYSRLFDKLDLFANGQYVDRTDDNATWLLYGRLVYRLKEWPYLGGGYLFRFGDSEFDPDEYWAPEELEQHQLFASIRGAWRSYGYSVSGQAGYSRERLADWQFIWGGNARLDWAVTRRLSLRLEGIYQESATYNRTTASAAAIVRF